MDVFARNMPGWGKLYSLPTEALAELDIPVLNLGPPVRMPTRTPREFISGMPWKCSPIFWNFS